VYFISLMRIRYRSTRGTFVCTFWFWF